MEYPTTRPAQQMRSPQPGPTSHLFLEDLSPATLRLELQALQERHHTVLLLVAELLRKNEKLRAAAQPLD